MNILLDKWRTVEDVQAEFNNAYPYLRIDFVKKGRAVTIGDLNADVKPCAIEVDDQMAVNQLEKIMSACFNVPVKILRKSGNVWLETSITGNWTLAQQNEHAKEISTNLLY